MGACANGAAAGQRRGSKNSAIQLNIYLEGWPSGLRPTLGKRVWGNLPRVRISPLPFARFKFYPAFPPTATQLLAGSAGPLASVFV